MNPELAEIYGTVEPTEEDFQKTAAVEALIKMAEAEGVDLDDFSPEQIEGMLEELQYGGEEEFTEKVAEADYLGRVMAHSMTQELGEIEKEASKAELIGPTIGKYRLGLRRGVDAVKNYHKRGAGLIAAGVKGGKGPAGKNQLGADLSKLDRAKAVGAGAARFLPHAAAAGAAGYAAKKKLSSIDEYAEQRAYEMLEEAGYLEKDASDEIEIRALQMLEANGYPVEW